MTAHIKWQEILREAWRNTSGGTSRAAQSTALFLLASLTFGFLSAQMVADISRRGAAFQAAGASVLMIAAEQGIDSAACERLGEVSTVQAAGALRRSPEEFLTTLPNFPISSFDGTPGILQILTPGSWPPVYSGVIWEESLLKMLGISAPSKQSLPLLSGIQAPVDGSFVASTDERNPSLTSSIINVTSQGTFDECWASFWPVPERAAEHLALTLVPSEHLKAEDVQISQWNLSQGRDFHASELEAPLTQRSLPFLAVVIGLVLGASMVHQRRLEHSSARHAGITAWDLALITAAEVLLWVVPAVLAGMLLLIPLASMNNPDPAFPAWLAGVRPLCLMGAATLFGATAHALSARESRLVAEFQRH